MAIKDFWWYKTNYKQPRQITTANKNGKINEIEKLKYNKLVQSNSYYEKKIQNYSDTYCSNHKVILVHSEHRIILTHSNHIVILTNSNHIVILAHSDYIVIIEHSILRWRKGIWFLLQTTALLLYC